MFKHAVAVTALSLILGFTSSSPAHAGERPGDAVCRAIDGAVFTQQRTTGACPSPVGICFDGVIRTNSALLGTTFFVVESAAPDPNDPTLLVYTGTLTVTHPNGTVTIFDTTGSVNQLTGEFVESDVSRSSDHAVLTITGTTNATLSSFSGTVDGTLCRPSDGGSRVAASP